MSKIMSVLYFHLYSLSRSSKYAIPVIFLVLLQMMLYMAIQTRPALFFSHLFLAEIFAFLVAVWLGHISHSWTDETTEQLLILRVKSDKFYYSIYVVFLFIISFCVSLLTISIPTVLSFTGFFEQFTLSYFGSSFLLFLGSNFAGITLGAMIHPRLTAKKGDTPLYAMFACLVAMTRYPISQAYPIFRFVLWVLPNVSAHHAMITDVSELTFWSVIPLFLVSVVYGIVYSVIRIVLLARKKF